MNQPTVLRRIALLLLAFCLSACSLWESTAPDTVLPQKTSTPSIESPTEAPPTTPPSACPAPATISLPELPADFPDYAASFASYLSQGGDPAELARLLGESFEYAVVDVTGNGVQEVVLVFVNPHSEALLPEGQLAVYGCHQGGRTLLYTYHAGEWLGLEWIGAVDLTDDGVADLVFSEVSCGAHTCWHTPHVWSWTGNDFAEQVKDDLLFPYPEFTLKPGRLDILSHGIGSVGAGPQRVFTTTLAWVSDRITITETAFASPAYRYHAFLDGDEALYAEDYAAATPLYLRALEDDTLMSGSLLFSEGEERSWFTALSHWRLMLIALRTNDPSTADSHFEQMQGASAPGGAGYPVVVMARRFWDAYEQNEGSLAYGCNAALVGEEVAEVLEFLNSFGYGNPEYALADLCPYLNP